MEYNKISTEIINKAMQWLDDYFDEVTRAEVKRMLEKSPDELVDAFYRNLEFGTGGLRGIMGAGTNRMNKYTVGIATQGLANYLLKQNDKNVPIKVAIGFDSRNNSRYFAEVTASVLSANNINVYIFDSLRPVAMLSFAIRHLNCNAGVVITASHNPKEYNGYKVYWSDGAQIINPHDKNIINEVNSITIDKIKFNTNKKLITVIGKEINEAYLKKVKELSLLPDVIKKYNNLNIVYSPLHGSGIDIIPKALKQYGFTNVNIVAEQSQPDGNFPTVITPNPEEASAMQMAVKLGKEINADIILATDPDADRVGLAVKNNNNDYILLNGNQTASLIIYYLLTILKEKGLLTNDHYIVKTIVTTELLKEMALKAGIECYDVLTGFKYIADTIRKLEGKKKFVAGGEESYGYLIGDFVRDKDAVISCCIIAETAAWACSKGKNLYELLQDIYIEYGYYYEKLVSIEKKGISGIKEIETMMKKFRKQPPEYLAEIKIVEIKDYKTGISFNTVNKEEKNIDLPKSDVIQWFLEDGSKITVRPSGTEPKIKFYFGMKTTVTNKKNISGVADLLDNKIQTIASELIYNSKNCK